MAMVYLPADNSHEPGNYLKNALDRLARGSFEKVDSERADAQVIDLFSGCGGMSLGFAAAGQPDGSGFRMVGGADLNTSSAASYQENLRTCGLVRDVRKMAMDDAYLHSFLDELSGFQRSQPLVLVGCAPCQGFTAHRKKNWNVLDARNDLVTAFADVAVKLDPAVVIMENVPEILSERYWGYFQAFRNRLEEAGYSVKQAIHNAAGFGVPQERFRALVVAVKGGRFHMPTPFLAPRDFLTVRDAIGNLPEVEPGETAESDDFHRSANHRASTLDVIRAVPKDGGSRPPDVGPRSVRETKGFADVYGRLAWDKPAITITHYARNPASGRFIHPEQDRGLTMREAARLQGFPDWFNFSGSFDDVFRQIGEAVPPPMAAAVAASVLKTLRGEPSNNSIESLVHAPVNDSFAGVIAGIKVNRK